MPEDLKPDRSSGRILVVIPAHNEEENIRSVLEELAALGLGLDVLVVDDASTDETPKILRELGQRTVRLTTNLGYGAAVQTGFKYALAHGYETVVQMDGDGQHDPSYIPALLAPVQSGECDVALGSRFLGTLAYEVPALRKLGIALFRKIVSAFLRHPVTDPTSGFQALAGRVVRFCSGDAYPMDYPDSDVLLALHFAGFRIREVPVRMRPRLHGQSIHRGWKAIYYVLKMFLAIFMVLVRHYGKRR
ncbi:MAG: glycosyltransferase family 2 protein [Planctomycetota bacterium]